MKTYVLIAWMLSASYAQTTMTEQDSSMVGKEVSTPALQAAVEAGLRLPVKFSQEKVSTFTVGERLSHHKVPGISFALIHQGEIAWTQGYGTIAATSGDNITANTVFQAASLAKPVTAFAVMRMQDQGVIDIQASIEHYLRSLTLAEGKQTPEVPVTFRNILDHSSGLTGGGYQGYEQGQAIPTALQVFTAVAPATNDATTVESKPGTEVHYSGAGYTLAEIALSDTFEQPFEHIMDAWVLSAVGMHESSFALSYPQQDGIQIALGHDTHGNTIPGGWRIHPEQAAAGLWSTPSDLAKLAIEVSKAYQGKSTLLSKAAARKMLAPLMPEQDLSDQFGGQPAMTFIIAGEGEHFVFQHGGGNMGYRSFLLMYPETGNGAVFMTNSDAGYSVGLEMMRAASFVYHWPDFKGKYFERRLVNQKEQALFIGVYPFDAGWQAEIIPVAQASGIAVKFPNGDIYPLTAVQGDHTYVHEDTGVEVSFNLSTGQPGILLYNQRAYKKQSLPVQ